ncbi:hypothetical protein V6N13_035548 [Hibiscus sabdariffa]
MVLASEDNAGRSTLLDLRSMLDEAISSPLSTHDDCSLNPKDSGKESKTVSLSRSESRSFSLLLLLVVGGP